MLSLLALDPSEGMDGHALTARIPEDRPAFFETLTDSLEYGWEPLLGVSRGHFKYIHSSEPELFDRALDPQEPRNLAAADPETSSQLEGLLASVFGDDLDRVAWVAPTVRPTAKDLERLQALGYAGGGAGRGATRSPKTMIRARHRVALADDPEKTAAETIAALRAVLGDHPDFYPAWKSLGDVYRRELDLDEAACHLPAVFELDPLHERCVEHLVEAFTSAGRVDALQEILRAHLAREPGTTKVGVALAGVLERRQPGARDDHRPAPGANPRRAFRPALTPAVAPRRAPHLQRSPRERSALQEPVARRRRGPRDFRGRSG